DGARAEPRPDPALHPAPRLRRGPTAARASPILRPLPRDHRFAAGSDRPLARRSALARSRGRRRARLPQRRRPCHPRDRADRPRARGPRLRLPRAVLAAVRARVGDDYVVGIRYLGDEVVAGGSDLEDAIWFGARFAEAGADYLSVSKGGRFEDAKQPKVGEAVYPYTGASGYECMPTV